MRSYCGRNCGTSSTGLPLLNSRSRLSPEDDGDDDEEEIEGYDTRGREESGRRKLREISAPDIASVENEAIGCKKEEKGGGCSMGTREGGRTVQDSIFLPPPSMLWQLGCLHTSLPSPELFFVVLIRHLFSFVSLSLRRSLQDGRCLPVLYH